MHHRNPERAGHAAPAHDPRSGERGVALVLSILFTIVVLGITVSGSLILSSHQATTRTNFVRRGQAVQFSKSGLIEALGWMRKQTSQPVTQFWPVLDTTTTPPRRDPLDPETGRGRASQIPNPIARRCAVWKQWDLDPDAQRLAWRQQMQCEDVSSMRGNLSPGSVWRMRSIGYVFRRADPTAAFNVAPNQIIGQELSVVEARRLALQPPGQAALCTRNGSTTFVYTRGRVVGGDLAGIYFLNGTGSVTVSGSGASVTGTPGQSATSTYEDGFEAVFGVSQSELTAMADYVITNPSAFPSPVPLNSVVFATTGMTFSSTLPLKGTGVVAIDGNTTIGQGSYSAFSGLLYVRGNLVVREPCELQGAVVVTGSVTVQGASDYATLTYDEGVLESLRQEIGTYRLSSAMSRPFAEDN